MSFEVSDLSSVNTSICSSSTKLFSIISSFCKLKPNSSRVGKDIISYDNLEISFLTVSSLNLVSKILLTLTIKSSLSILPIIWLKSFKLLFSTTLLLIKHTTGFKFSTLNKFHSLSKKSKIFKLSLSKISLFLK